MANTKTQAELEAEAANRAGAQPRSSKTPAELEKEAAERRAALTGNPGPYRSPDGPVISHGSGVGDGRPADVQAAEIQKEIDALEAKKKLVTNVPQEYPKWIPDPTYAGQSAGLSGPKGITVSNLEEEVAVRAAYAKASDPEAQKAAREEAEKAQKKAHDDAKARLEAEKAKAGK